MAGDDAIDIAGEESGNEAIFPWLDHEV